MARWDPDPDEHVTDHPGRINWAERPTKLQLAIIGAVWAGAVLGCLVWLIHSGGVR